MLPMLVAVFDAIVSTRLQNERESRQKKRKNTKAPDEAFDEVRDVWIVVVVFGGGGLSFCAKIVDEIHW